jgi:[DsrC]-trisulfide reductase subunit J
MRDRPQIVAALLVFAGLFTFPIWHGLAKPAPAAAPAVKLPLTEKQCVAPLAYMRDAHMQLLIEWREDVVRHNHRQFTAFNGKVYDKSLTRTCLAQCHTNKAEFCDRCHTYAGVSGPYCFDCHNKNAVLTARSMR